MFEDLNRLISIAKIDKFDDTKDIDNIDSSVEIEESRGLSEDNFKALTPTKQIKYIKEHPTSKYGRDPKWLKRAKMLKTRLSNMKNSIKKASQSKSKLDSKVAKRIKQLEDEYKRNQDEYMENEYKDIGWDYKIANDTHLNMMQISNKIKRLKQGLPEEINTLEAYKKYPTKYANDFLLTEKGIKYLLLNKDPYLKRVFTKNPSSAGLISLFKHTPTNKKAKLVEKINKMFGSSLDNILEDDYDLNYLFPQTRASSDINKAIEYSLEQHLPFYKGELEKYFTMYRDAPLDTKMLKRPEFYDYLKSDKEMRNFIVNNHIKQSAYFYKRTPRPRDEIEKKDMIRFLNKIKLICPKAEWRNYNNYYERMFKRSTSTV